MRNGQGAEHAFAEQLGDAIESVIGMGMMTLGRRIRLGLAIDRGRRGVDDLFDPGLQRQPGEFEGGVRHALEAEPGLLGAVGDPQGGLMEHEVGVGQEPAHQLRIADVALDE